MRIAAKKNAPSSLKEALWEYISRSKKALTKAIKSSKKSGWKEVRDDVDRDVWGKGYVIVKNRLIGYPPKPQLSMQAVKKVASCLFPEHKPVSFICCAGAPFIEFTLGELERACAKIKTRKHQDPETYPPKCYSTWLKIGQT